MKNFNFGRVERLLRECSKTQNSVQFTPVKRETYTVPSACVFSGQRHSILRYSQCRNNLKPVKYLWKKWKHTVAYCI